MTRHLKSVHNAAFRAKEDEIAQERMQSVQLPPPRQQMPLVASGSGGSVTGTLKKSKHPEPL